MTVHLHHGDLPEGLDLGKLVAVDTETLGLKPRRDRLCLVQLSSGDGDAHLVKFGAPGVYDAPRLKALMADQAVTKIFHYARFDVGTMKHHLGIDTQPIYCTKIASKLARTYTDKHGLKDLVKELVGVDLSKASQSSDWAAATLSKDQLDYAASDVLHLHKVKAILDMMLAREGRTALAEACFRFLPTRAALDLGGWAGDGEGERDIFAH